MNIAQLLTDYEAAVKAAFPKTWKPGYALSPNQGEVLFKELERLKPRTILDLGAGSSSVLLRNVPLDVRLVITAEHDPDWSEWMQDYLDDGLFITTDEARSSNYEFDLAFVDHGPTMDVRLKDLEWITRRCSHLILDDWRLTARPNYARRAATFLRSKGLEPKVLPNSMRQPGNRHLVYCKGLR